MNAHPIDGVDESYLDTLPNKAVDMLNSPVLMCLFYALLARGKREASTFKDEGTFFSAVFEEIENDMSRRIEECCKADKNPRATAVKVLNLVSKLSLEVFSSGSYFILGDKYKEFVHDVLDCGAIQHSQDIDFSTVLSCVLTPDKDGSYHFWHNSFLENLAAKFIVLILHKSNTRSPVQWIRSKLGFKRFTLDPGPTNRPASEFDANPFFKIIMDSANSSSLDMLKRSVLMSF